MSVIMQTLPPDEIILYDDSSRRVDLRTVPTYQHIFDLMAVKKIKWRVIFGRGRGQHWGHQYIQDAAQDLIWRIDDDEIAENSVLHTLALHMVSPNVGAVAGLVLPPVPIVGDYPANTIANIDEGNCQWQVWDGIKECEHLYSSYLYRKGIQNFDINLSPVAHREETLHTYGIYKKGYKLIVDGSAVTYHFRAPEGGIRQGSEMQQWQHDEIAFREALREYDGHIIPFLDCGMGDHLLFKPCLAKLKEKYKKVTLAVCFPELFPHEECISIAEGLKLCNPERHNVYKWAIDYNWKDKEMKYAYAQMYGVEI